MFSAIGTLKLLYRITFASLISQRWIQNVTLWTSFETPTLRSRKRSSSELPRLVSLHTYSPSVFSSADSKVGMLSTSITSSVYSFLRPESVISEHDALEVDFESADYPQLLAIQKHWLVENKVPHVEYVSPPVKDIRLLTLPFRLVDLL